MIYESSIALKYPKNATIPDLLFHHNLMNVSPEKPAIIDGPTGRVVFTYSTLREAVQRVASHLQNDLGIQRGCVVGILSTNKYYFPVVVHAILAVGGVVSALNPLYQVDVSDSSWNRDCVVPLTQKQEIAHALKLSRPRHIFCEQALLPNLVGGLQKAQSPNPPRLHVWDTESPIRELASTLKVEEIIRRGSLNFRPWTLKPGEAASELAFICFSSGTSGLVKGVKLSHGNVVANIFQQGTGLRGMFGPKTTFALAVPMFHILGLAGFCCQYIIHGAPIVLFTKFDFPLLIKAIERDRITHMNVVPPIALEFLHNPAAKNADFSSIQAMMNAAAPLKESIADLLCQKLNCVVTQWYGMTEASPSTMSQREDEVHIRGTIGRLLPGIQLRIVDEEGKDVIPGSPGEFLIRGPNVMQGYVEQKHGSSTVLQPHSAFTSDGFFKTGDIGYIDKDGYCFLVDRAKEMIKVKGHQVAPAELEAILLSHHNVLDAAVCGVEVDHGTSEIPIAYISHPTAPEFEPENDPEEKRLQALLLELRALVDSKVASYKKLRGGVHVLEGGVPRNVSGKILRRLLPPNLARQQRVAAAAAARSRNKASAASDGSVPIPAKL